MRHALLVAEIIFIFLIMSGCVHTGNRISRSFVRIQSPVIALVNVLLIDGRGTPGLPNQRIIIDNGKISAVGGPEVTIPSGAQVMDFSGSTAIPGIVGMHEHLHYTYLPNGSPDRYLVQQTWSFPLLYLASGVTTARTAGSIEPYTDLGLKKMIDSGRYIGPRLFLTAPYINGPNSDHFPFHAFPDAPSVARMVDYWASEGFTSFKLYDDVTRAQLAAAVEAAHRHGFKVTAHLWSVTFREAIDRGIDSLEHGMSCSTDFYPKKVPDQSPPEGSLDYLKTGSQEMGELINYLVKKHVAITSTLANLEASKLAFKYELDPRLMDLLPPPVQQSVLARKATAAKKTGPKTEAEFNLEMEFERRFFEAGGLLMAGSDPTGYGAVMAGLADHREIELLVEAGLSPVQAIQVATANGAKFLGILNRLGTIEVGKGADIVIVKGNPETHISDIRNVTIVFKDGIGYDPSAITEVLKGRVGLQ